MFWELFDGFSRPAFLWTTSSVRPRRSSVRFRPLFGALWNCRVTAQLTSIITHPNWYRTRGEKKHQATGDSKHVCGGSFFFRIPFRASVPFWGTDQHVSITGMCVVAFSEKIIAFSCWALQLLTYWKNHCLVSNLIRSVFSCAGLEAFWSGIDCVGCPGHRDGHATR